MFLGPKRVLQSSCTVLLHKCFSQLKRGNQMFTLDPYLQEVFYGLDNWWAFLAQQQKFLKRVRKSHSSLQRARLMKQDNIKESYPL